MLGIGLDTYWPLFVLALIGITSLAATVGGANDVCDAYSATLWGLEFFIGGRRTARRELESLSQNIRRLIPPRMVLIFIHRVIFNNIFPIASYSDDWVQSPVDGIELRSRHSAANPKVILKSGWFQPFRRDKSNVSVILLSVAGLA